LFDTGSFVIAAAANWGDDDRSGEIGGVDCGPDGQGDCDDDWSAGIGLNGNLGDALSFTVAVAAGEGTGLGIYNLSLSPGADDEWWGVTGGVIWTFASPWSLQLGAGYAEVERNTNENFDDQDQHSFDATATLFWDPVDQLTLGLGAGYHDNDVQCLGEASDDHSDCWVAGFGAYFRF
jgi:hypothetical protein